MGATDTAGRRAGRWSAAVVGGGLAGCEAAWALAERGVAVTLYEMRPRVKTPAHQTDRLAEIVCSNTFKSTELTNAHGLLKAELRLLGSLLLDVADQARVPGGAALAVDRAIFSNEVTRRVLAHPRVTVVREEVMRLPAPAVVATGPLTSDALARVIAARLAVTSLAFYDAIAPIVSAESLDLTRLYRRSRYGKGGGDDYLNVPLTEAEYYAFVEALCTAEQFEGHEFDKLPAAAAPAAYFEGCLPIEEMARRGKDVLRFGPMKPVGLPDPRTGREPFAVVQLRQEDRAAQMWNLVGFQTRMRIPEQKRVLATLPGLAAAEFLRYGSIHRNTYLNSPATLTAHLSAKDDEQLLFAGQLVGVEGYTESLGTGLLAGINLARMLQGEAPLLPPAETMLGALMKYVHEADPAHFQPMNANFGLLPPLEERIRDKQMKKERLAERALGAMREFAAAVAAARSRPSPRRSSPTGWCSSTAWRRCTWSRSSRPTSSTPRCAARACRKLASWATVGRASFQSKYTISSNVARLAISSTGKPAMINSPSSPLTLLKRVCAATTSAKPGTKRAEAVGEVILFLNSFRGLLHWQCSYTRFLDSHQRFQHFKLR